jgi:bacteriocin biosynthesis cyclodehydratase domain-containing protein
MIYRLDPAVPLVWRTPDTIQLGIDQPMVIFPGVTGALMQVLEALRRGVPRSGAILLGREAGASDGEIFALLHRLRPVLLGDGEPGQAKRLPPASAPALVCVDGAGPTADRIRLLLHDLGFGVDSLRNTTTTGLDVPRERDTGTGAGTAAAIAADTASAAAERPLHHDDRDDIPGLEASAHSVHRLAAPAPAPTVDLAVVVAHYVIDPARHGRWLNRDVPHLPVVFGDTSIRLGPLVEPGSGPCLYCLELARMDDDPAWPAMAAQLLRATAATETTRASIDVATQVAGIVDDRLRSGARPLFGESVSISAAAGKVRRLGHLPHERCGCRSLPENVTALVASAAAGQTRPSSAAADDVPA